MAEEKTYKQIPLVSSDGEVVCPICKKRGTFDTKLCKVVLRKSNGKLRVVSENLHYCYNCDIPYATSSTCTIIKLKNQKYKLITFKPPNNATKNDIQKAVLSDYKPNFKSETNSIYQQKSKKDVTTNQLNNIKIGDKDFDLYPVSKCNVKNLPRNVYTIPLGFTNCPMCGRTLLRDFMYAIQINDNECIKSNGCTCIRWLRYFSLKSCSY